MAGQIRTLTPEEIRTLFPRASASLLEVNQGAGHLAVQVTPPAPTVAPTDEPKKKRSGRRPGVMNKTEAEFARILEAKKGRAEIAAFSFEKVSIRLADGIRYTPDFCALLGDDGWTMEDLVDFSARSVMEMLGNPELRTLALRFLSTPPQVTFFEVKGAHIWDDSKDRFKMARELHEWAKWQMWQRKRGEWRQLFAREGGAL